MISRFASTGGSSLNNSERSPAQWAAAASGAADDRQLAPAAHRPPSCARVRVHALYQALRSHVGPVPLDVVEAVLPGVRAAHNLPALRYGRERRPHGMLLLGIDEYQVRAVLVVERVHFCSTPLSSTESTALIRSSGDGSVISTWVQSTSWTSSRPVTWSRHRSADGVPGAAVAAKNTTSPS